MSVEKIPCWVREFSSLTSIFNSIILHSNKFRNKSYPDYISPENHFFRIKKEKNGFKADCYQYFYKLLSNRQNWCDSPVETHQNQSIRTPIPKGLKQTATLVSLSLACGLGSGCSLLSVRPAPSMPEGGAFPDSPITMPSLLINRLGVKQWFDNRRGTHPLTDLPSTAMKGYCHPLQGKGFLSQGTRGNTHQGRMKYAYDFGVPIGMPVYAMQGGRVIGLRDKYPDKGGRRRNAEKFNFIWLEHSNGVRSAYIHLQQNFKKKIPIKLNDWVRTGDLIGYSGNSGWSSAPHLHVEVHSISESGFGQTLPFEIVSKCHNTPFASVRQAS